MTERPAESRPHNRVVVDTIIERDGEIVLIKRKYDPFKGMWCIPGGHIEYGEQVETAVKREAKEETGLDIETDELLGIYDEPGRDPRGPVISLTYICSTDDTDLDPDTDAADARWFPLDDLPDDLGFDHEQMIDDYLSQRNG